MTPTRRALLDALLLERYGPVSALEDERCLPAEVVERARQAVVMDRVRVLLCLPGEDVDEVGTECA